MLRLPVQGTLTRAVMPQKLVPPQLRRKNVMLFLLHSTIITMHTSHLGLRSVDTPRISIGPAGYRSNRD